MYLCMQSGFELSSSQTILDNFYIRQFNIFSALCSSPSINSKSRRLVQKMVIASSGQRFPARLVLNRLLPQPSCYEWVRSSTTRPFTILKRCNPSIEEFYVVQERRELDFKAPKSWKGRSGVSNCSRCSPSAWSPPRPPPPHITDRRRQTQSTTLLSSSISLLSNTILVRWAGLNIYTRSDMSGLK